MGLNTPRKGRKNENERDLLLMLFENIPEHQAVLDWLRSLPSVDRQTEVRKVLIAHVTGQHAPLKSSLPAQTTQTTEPTEETLRRAHTAQEPSDTSDDELDDDMIF